MAVLCFGREKRPFDKLGQTGYGIGCAKRSPFDRLRVSGRGGVWLSAEVWAG